MKMIVIINSFTFQISIENENLDPTDQQSQGNDNTQPVNATPSTSSQQTLRRRKIPPELREAENQMKEAFTMLKNVASKNDDEKEDECDLYGKILAKKLRKLPEFEREFLMHDIDGMVLNAMRSRLSVSTPSYFSTEPSNSSPVSSSFSRPTSANTDYSYTSPHASNENTLQNPTYQQCNTEVSDTISQALLMTFGHTDTTL